MDTSTQNTGRKKTTLVVALVACLVLAVGAGVFAWFSAQDAKTNTFVAGDGITEPEKKPDPDKSEGGGEGGDQDIDPGDHFITETEWKDNSAITPGAIVPKNPNVGIGKDSKDAYVFVEVENNLGTDAYFVLGSKWAPVTGKATAYEGSKGYDATISEDNKKRCYTGGLFVYVGDSKAADESGMAMLKSDTSKLKDMYTGEAFNRVYTNANFKLDTSKTIEVKAYLAAASADGEDMTSDTVKNQIIAKAKDWAGTNTK